MTSSRLEVALARMRAANISLSILKIDCEGCEHTFFTPPVLSLLGGLNVQILIEVHWTRPTSPMSHAGGMQMAFLWRQFTRGGFVTFHKEPNIEFSDGSCVEYALMLHR
uniref:Methyltransferase domain-containing protein n=1 Tax=Florenciella parvula TaxID=236787 RepID=A0A7S2BRD2_9STRA|mmetsp:Transcript_19495/g.40853  ORF Transcript_19495/g.40853 Transcript_19495/m.40853 type:complete len:109 (+) Transcript_19495:394-720(+)